MQVYPRVILGNKYDSSNAQLFNTSNIGYVVNATDNLPSVFLSLPKFEPTIEAPKLCTHGCDKGEDDNMIACDGPCSNWLHFDCVGVSAAEVDQIDRYFCTTCSSTVAHDVKYFKIPIQDSADQDIKSYLNDACDFIASAIQHTNMSVLVHCREGRSRSCTVIVAYGMKYLGMTLARAYNNLKDMHARLNINDGFKRQLMEYEIELLKSRGEEPVNSHNFFPKRVSTPSRAALESLANSTPKRTPKRTPLKATPKFLILEDKENATPSKGTKRTIPSSAKTSASKVRRVLGEL